MNDRTEQEMSTDSERPTQVLPVLPLSVFLLLIVALAALILFSNPGSGGPMVVLVFLLLVFLVLLTGTSVLLRLSERFFVGFKFSAARMVYTSVALAFGGVYLLGLQTLGQLQVMDAILVCIFELLLNFYLFRRF